MNKIKLDHLFQGKSK